MKQELSNRNLFSAQVFVTPVLDQIAEPPQAAPSYCARCGSGMLPLEKAARLCQCTPRMQYRWVEQGKLHFCELADGSVLVCGQTLAALVNELESDAARLTDPMAPQKNYATNRIL